MLYEDSNARMVIGMLNTSLAIKDRSKNLRLLFFHHCKKFICSKKSNSKVSSSRYMSSCVLSGLLITCCLQSFESYHNIWN